jgi:hypothetical protein
MKHDDPIPKSKVDLYRIFKELRLTQHGECSDDCVEKDAEKLAIETAEQQLRDEIVYEVEGLMCQESEKCKCEAITCFQRNIIIGKAARLAKGKADYFIHI